MSYMREVYYQHLRRVIRQLLEQRCEALTVDELRNAWPINWPTPAYGDLRRALDAFERTDWRREGLGTRANPHRYRLLPSRPPTPCTGAVPPVRQASMFAAVAATMQ